MNPPKAIFCWSGGKDSAFCLHKVLQEKSYEVCYLLTTINDSFKRVSMHGVREELLTEQVASIGIPLLPVRVSEGSNSEYEQLMEAALLNAKRERITHVIFGDIFLEDLRAYREQNLAKVGMTGVFPLWKKDTTVLLNGFINAGFKTILCCTNDGYLGDDWVGREINNSFVDDLPPGVDPCGENGEYHTFCYDGPIFKKPVGFTIGEKIYKSLVIMTADPGQGTEESPTRGFWFCDLIPV